MLSLIFALVDIFLAIIQAPMEHASSYLTAVTNPYLSATLLVIALILLFCAALFAVIRTEVKNNPEERVISDSLTDKSKWKTLIINLKRNEDQ